MGQLQKPPQLQHSNTLFLLPNELLMTVLLDFPTRQLLPLTTVCARFHDLILRILHRRLLAAASLKDHKLILECFHPASKSTEPYLFCNYLGTPGLSSDIEGQGLAYEHEDNLGRLGKLGGLFSRFRPLQPEALLESRRTSGQRPHPAGGILVPRLGSNIVEVEEEEGEDGENSGAVAAEEKAVSHWVKLDAGDPFFQLCVVTNLVKLGPRTGLFENFVNVSEGLVRIKRDWLAARAREKTPPQPQSQLQSQRAASSFGKEVAEKRDAQVAARTLWIDNKNDIGIRVRINETSWNNRLTPAPAPILFHRDEEPAVNYKMEYEELSIRTTHLLLAVEKSLLQDRNEPGGRAMVFGSFRDS